MQPAVRVPLRGPLFFIYRQYPELLIAMELSALTIHQLSEKLASGEITSVDITRSVLERIDQVEDKVGAFITLDRESALAQASEADRSRQKGGTGDEELQGSKSRQAHRPQIMIPAPDLVQTCSLTGIPSYCPGALADTCIPDLDIHGRLPPHRRLAPFSHRLWPQLEDHDPWTD